MNDIETNDHRLYFFFIQSMCCFLSFGFFKKKKIPHIYYKNKTSRNSYFFAKNYAVSAVKMKLSVQFTFSGQKFFY